MKCFVFSFLFLRVLYQHKYIMERSQFSFRKLGLRSNPGAGGTSAIEISDMSPDPAVKSLSGCLHDGINTIHVQINEASAFRTHEMIMFGSIGIKMVNTVTDPES